MNDPVEILEHIDHAVRPSPSFEKALVDRVSSAMSSALPEADVEPGHGGLMHPRGGALASRRVEQRFGWIVALGTGALTIAAIAVPAWLGRGQPVLTAPPTATASTASVGSITQPPVNETVPSSAAMPATPPTAPALPTGWNSREVPLDPLEGSTYLLGGSHFFVWGGQVDREPDIRNTGWLVDFQGEIVAVNPAPIEARSQAAGTWTGSGFVVFGGRPLDWETEPSFVDGAIFDPATGTWTTIPPAPVEPGPRASAAWTGSRLAVWVSSPDSSSDGESGGQVAIYDPTTETWDQLPAPPASLSDAKLFAGEDRLTLIGGPNMGSQVAIEGRLVATVYEPESATWTEPAEWEFTDHASVTQTEDGRFLAATDSGVIGEFDGSAWTQLGTFESSPAYPAMTASGGGETYVLGLETYRLGEAGQLTAIAPDRAIEWGYSGSIAVSDEGELLTLGRAADADGLFVGPVTLTIYDPPS